MKLKYDFEVMELDGRFVAVPVGKGASDFRGILKMNSSAKQIFELLKDDTSEQRLYQILDERYPSKEQLIKDYVDEIINKLRLSNLLNT